jgi:predicted nucleotidyltransferase
VSGPAFDELLRRLVSANVRFVLVGGLAVNAWGVVRGTKDVDIVPDADPENLARLAELAVELGGHIQTSEALAASKFSIAALLAEGDRVLVTTDLGPLDIVQGLPGVPDHTTLAQRATVVSIVGVDVAVCSLDDLRAMKRAAGRPRDIADLADLDAANEPPSV